MRGVILAGGTGSRLWPLTKCLNKHLLPVGNRPMIEWPLRLMANSGIHDVLVVMGGDHFAGIAAALGDGSEYGVDILYSVQEKPAGIADAISRAKTFAGGESIFVILGDNVFSKPLGAELDRHERLTPDCCGLFLVSRNEFSAYGVAILDDQERIIKIIEKPTGLAPPQSVVTGAYVYPPDVFDLIEKLSPSGRRELEVSDLNQLYVDQGRVVPYDIPCEWYDCGESIEHYYRVNHKIMKATSGFHSLPA